MKQRCRRTSRVWSVVSVSLLSALMLAGAPQRISAQTLPASRYKNGSSLRSVFRPAVKEARLSTVEILADGKRAALGTVVDADGYILTKASTLKGNVVCRIGKRTVSAEVVGVSAADDLALLKVDAHSLVPAKWRTNGDPHVGQWVITAGVQSVPVSVGVLSVKRRRIPAPRPLLGVSIEDHELGVRIVEVSKGSGAEKAGLKPGDIVTWISGAAVNNRQALVERIRKFRPGDTLLLKVRRDKTVMSIRATLGSSISPTSRRAIQNKMGGRLSKRRHGFPVALQHDSYLRPEDCGGPVVDLTGRVIGINIARAGRTESYIIPADRIQKLLPDLKSGKLAPKKTEQATSSQEKETGQ